MFMVAAIRSRAARGKLDRQIFIHIGTHKTATTSIQGLMARAERQFARHGIFIPKAGVISRELFGHHNIGWTLRGDRRANPQWGSLDNLCAELSRTRLKRALISSEDFEYLVDYPDVLKMIERRLKTIGWTPTYILFLRNPTDYAISLFYELSRNHGFTDTFGDFIERLLDTSCHQLPVSSVLLRLWHQHGKLIRLFKGKIPCDDIGLVIDIFNDSPNPPSRLLRDASTVMNHPVDSSHRNAGKFCNLADCRHE